MTSRLPIAFAAFFVCAATARAQDLLVQCKRLVVAPDTVLTDGRMLVQKGVVAYLGAEIPAEARANAKVVDCGDATVVPGFVLANTTLGQERDLAEGSIAFTPDLRAGEAFDPWQEDLGKAAAAGVTSLGLAPSPRNVAGGLLALVKPGAEHGELAAPDLHAQFSLVEAARNPERAPTSLMGAKELLRTTFQAARAGAQGGPDAAVLRQVAQGTRRAFVYADTYAELTAALDLAREFGFEPVLVGARDAEKLLPRLVQQKASVVLGPLVPEARQAVLALPTKLAEAGVPFAFGGRPEQLRLSAVLAVRAGLDRKTALGALTRVPARLLDQENALGVLRAGHAADFVVFGGDPLDLDSAHVATFVGGVLVRGKLPQPTRPVAPSPAAGGR